MSGATCATCRFFGGGNQCRLKPPAWISDGTLFQPGWFFPRVDPGDWCGEHAPTPAVGVPGLPELPHGWEWRIAERHTEARCAFDLRVSVRGPAATPIVSVSGIVRADVVEMTIARHRTRVGGAA